MNDITPITQAGPGQIGSGRHALPDLDSSADSCLASSKTRVKLKISLVPELQMEAFGRCRWGNWPRMKGQRSTRRTLVYTWQLDILYISLDRAVSRFYWVD